MPKYLITYIGKATGNRPEERRQRMDKYREWVASFGDAFLNPGHPIDNTQTISSNRTVSIGGASSMSGFSIIQVDSREELMVIAKACPFLDADGSIEVSEIVDIPGLSGVA